MDPTKCDVHLGYTISRAPKNNVCCRWGGLHVHSCARLYLSLHHRRKTTTVGGLKFSETAIANVNVFTLWGAENADFTRQT